jgi:hypothetical protein
MTFIYNLKIICTAIKFYEFIKLDLIFIDISTVRGVLANRSTVAISSTSFRGRFTARVTRDRTFLLAQAVAGAPLQRGFKLAAEKRDTRRLLQIL